MNMQGKTENCTHSTAKIFLNIDVGFSSALTVRKGCWLKHRLRVLVIDA